MDEVFIFITHFEIGMSEQKFKSQCALYKNPQTTDERGLKGPTSLENQRLLEPPQDVRSSSSWHFLCPQ